MVYMKKMENKIKNTNVMKIISWFQKYNVCIHTQYIVKNFIFIVTNQLLTQVNIIKH